MCLLSGASTPYFRVVRNETGQIKRADQKEPIRDATSGGDQRSRSETQRQEEIKGVDLRRNVKGRSRQEDKESTRK
jgi:hypothetical protein